MLIEHFKIWSCFSMLTIVSVCCAVDIVEYQHQHRPTKHSIQNRTPSRRHDFRPGTGEILVRDSVLYTDRTSSSSAQITKRMWPMDKIQDTFSTIMEKFQAGAKMVKDMIMPKKKKKQQMKIVPAMPTTATKKVPAKMKPATMEMEMMEMEKSPSITVDNFKPDYLISSTGQLYPYADATYEAALLELEKKEEQKVEATMHTFHYHATKESNAELIRNHLESDSEQWNASPPTTQKPTKVSQLHTTIQGSTDIKPVHEEIIDDIDEDESKVTAREHPKYESTVEKPETSFYRMQGDHKRIRKTVNADVEFPGKSNLVTTERPNYPEHFFEKKSKFLPTVLPSALPILRAVTKRPNSERINSAKAKFQSNVIFDESQYNDGTDGEMAPSQDVRSIRNRPWHEKAEQQKNKTIVLAEKHRQNGRGAVKYG